MQKLTITRQTGNIARTLAGRDHVSGLLFFRQGQTTPVYKPVSTQADITALTGMPAGAETQIAEALRLCPGITLWVGLAQREATFKAVAEMQRAAGGNIRQLGILDDQTAIARATVTALQAVATSLDTEWMPLQIVIAPKVAKVATSGEGALPTDLASSAPNVAVLISKDTAEESVPAIGTLIGTLAARAVHESIAWVERCETGLTAPAFSDGTAYSAVDSATLQALDEARYIYLRTYPGLAGVYFSDSHNLARATDDYNSIERQRTMDKAVRGTRAYLLPELGRPIFFNDDGTLRADTLQHLRTVAGKAVEEMERAGEVSGWQVDIDPAQDVLGTDTVTFTIRAIPVGVMRSATVSIGYAKKLQNE